MLNVRRLSRQIFLYLILVHSCSLSRTCRSSFLLSLLCYNVQCLLRPPRPPLKEAHLIHACSRVFCHASYIFVGWTVSFCALIFSFPSIPSHAPVTDVSLAISSTCFRRSSPVPSILSPNLSLFGCSILILIIMALHLTILHNRLVASVVRTFLFFFSYV